MRPASASVFVFAVTAAMVAAPTPSLASAHLQIPHSKHHRGRAEPAANTPAAPVSDVPEPIWSSSHNRR